MCNAIAKQTLSPKRQTLPARQCGDSGGDEDARSAGETIEMKEEQKSGAANENPSAKVQTDLREGQAASLQNPGVFPFDETRVLFTKAFEFGVGENVVVAPGTDLAQVLIDSSRYEIAVSSRAGVYFFAGEKPFDVVGHFLRGAITVFRFLFEGLEANVLEIAGNFGV